MQKEAGNNRADFVLVFFLKKKVKLAEYILFLWCFKNIFLKLRILSNKLLVNVLLNLKLCIFFFVTTALAL